MNEPLKLDNELHKLKLSASFASSSSNSAETFHTIKYDFKPVSMDITKAAKIEVSSTSQVTVTVPHTGISGMQNLVYKGNIRNHTKKDCILVIDRDTGEFTLERLCGNILVKQTRSQSHVKPTQPLRLPPSPSTPKPNGGKNKKRQSGMTTAGKRSKNLKASLKKIKIDM